MIVFTPIMCLIKSCFIMKVIKFLTNIYFKFDRF